MHTINKQYFNPNKCQNRKREVHLIEHNFENQENNTNLDIDSVNQNNDTAENFLF